MLRGVAAWAWSTANIRVGQDASVDGAAERQEARDALGADDGAHESGWEAEASGVRDLGRWVYS